MVVIIPENRTILNGQMNIRDGKIGGTVTEVKAGRLLTRNAGDSLVKINDMTTKPAGFLVYEKVHAKYKPANITTAMVADQIAAIGNGPGVELVGYTTEAVTKDQLMCPAADGKLRIYDGGGIKEKIIPFVKQTSEFDTTWDLPDNALVMSVFPEVTTALASGTIDIGILSSEANGDADGFIDGASCATAGYVKPISVHATEASLTVGLLSGTHVKSADGTPLYAAIAQHYQCDGTAKSISYTTSDHVIAGNIHILYTEPGNYGWPVAQCIKTASTAGNVAIRSLI